MKLKLFALSAVAATALFLTAGTAFAGGWAVTTIDEVPAPFVAGQTYEIGYSIRQHGMTPVNIDGTGIVIRSADGTVDRFPGNQDGAVGHYVASVRFPAGGSFTWVVDQGWFADQDLGAVDVVESSTVAASLSGTSTSVATTSVEVSTPAALRAALLFTAVAALGLFVVQAGEWLSRRRLVEA